MALTYTRDTRNLDIKGIITYRNGTQQTITSKDVASYSINESVGSEGLALGTTEASSFSLTLENSNHTYNASDLDNAEVHMFIGIETDGEIVYSDFGVWYVHGVNCSEQSTSISINGYDALSTLFNATFSDNAKSYPTTIASLASTMCTAAGVTLASANFPNGAVRINSMPSWDEEVTIRDIVGYCAACAGGFAKMTRDGKLEIISYVAGETYSLGTNMYTSLTSDGGSDFSFNAIEIKFSSDDEEFSRYAVTSSITDNATNTIQIEGNPLMTKTIVQSLVNEFKGLSLSPRALEWVGDPVVQCGDILQVTDKKGTVHKILINKQTLSFDGGLDATSSCEVPSLNSTNGSSYTTSGNMMDSNGNIKATRISGLDGSVISATSAHFENLSATTTQTDRLLSALIDATKLKAENINVKSAEIDSLTAAMASVIKATVDKIKAGTIDTDTLIANMGDLVALRVDKVTASTIDTDELGVQLAKIVELRANEINADNVNVDELAVKIADVIKMRVDKIDATMIETDELAAALAKFTTLYASVGKFDLSTVSNLLANALILEAGVANSMLITNLAVTSANLLNATVDKLVLKGSDDKYYHLFVGASGKITTEEVTVTEEEIEAGQTTDGRQITATTTNVADLNAQSVKAKEAILGTIVTKALTAGKITAVEATLTSAVIPTIYTDTITALGNSLDLSANASITATVEGATEPISDAVSTVQTLAEQVKDTAENAQTAAQAAQETADAATEATANIQTQLIQTKDSVDLIQTTTTDLEGRVSTIESGVHVEGATVEIYTSESPYRNTLTNEGWMISENGTPVITCAETKLSAPRVQISDALIIGVAAWKPGEDKHLRLLKYGR